MYVVTTKDDYRWSMISQLVAPDANAEDWFGYSIAMSSNYIVVGAPNCDIMGSNSGKGTSIISFLIDLIALQALHTFIPHKGINGHYSPK